MAPRATIHSREVTMAVITPIPSTSQAIQLRRNQKRFERVMASLLQSPSEVLL